MAPAEGRDRGAVRGAGPGECRSTTAGRRSSPRPRSPACWSSTCAVHGDNRGWFKENWQRAQDGRPRAARLRAGAEQRLVQRRRRHHPGHPRRALGQVRLGGHRTDLRRLGRPAARADASARSSPPSSARTRAVFVPRGVGNALPDARGRHRLLLPRQRPLEPGRQDSYTFLNLADETVGDRLADPARPRPSCPRRTGATRASPTCVPMAPAPALVLGAQRPARPGAARRRCPDAVAVGPRRARPGRPGVGRRASTSRRTA